ncbi:MAG TPA: hypothetical protein PLO24_05670 [Bacteroidales bacterium]|jgi:enamine deaminase RidA (YjgF/YER057c/UK114 family)|nr:hypothetical protein [Bacteroidales bacterium]HOS72499.1 hypothetical protein [Bacteroidales bacterium]HQH25002.1 hypothetical protein [Bacteroidales bacterium]HQJ83063.1 hypothetical protein [Bacteroidales bacterium]
MAKTYYALLPSVTGSVEEEFLQILDQILDISNSGFTPVRINIFADLPDFASLITLRGKITEICTHDLGPACPAVSLTAQPPEKPWKTAVEAVFIKTGSASVRGGYHNTIPYIVLESSSGRELLAGGLSSYMHPDDTRAAAEAAFDTVLRVLEKEKMSADNIVRQWNYIGNILQMKNDFQNYQIFNEVRSEYYGRYRSLSRYPAATGVGMNHGGVIIDICAFQPSDFVSLVAVKNPGQVNAYEYGQKVLKGSAGKGKNIKNPPQFERGLLVSAGDHSVLLISGTASIIGQETVGTGDIDKQTTVTIENISKLSDPSRIGQLMGYPGEPVKKYGFLRVYVKRQNDFSTVRQKCKEYFPGVPVSYIGADICRDDLLVEIEGEAELMFNKKH